VSPSLLTRELPRRMALDADAGAFKLFVQVHDASRANMCKMEVLSGFRCDADLNTSSVTEARGDSSSDTQRFEVANDMTVRFTRGIHHTTVYFIYRSTWLCKNKRKRMK
jgi:hypothetical protein